MTIWYRSGSRSRSRRARPLLCVLALAAVASCTTDDGPPDEAGRTAQSSDTVAAGLPAPADTAWTVRPTGAGPVRIGMTASDARQVLNGALDLSGDSLSCYFADPLTGPDSLEFMVVDDRVVRVDVRGGSVATAEGARIGDSEQRIHDLYAGLVAVEPHKYVEGHYLIITPAEAPDTTYRLVFETDGRRVTRYRAGVLDPVIWVEGCS